MKNILTALLLICSLIAARASVGVSSLPGGAPVEIELVAEVEMER